MCRRLVVLLTALVQLDDFICLVICVGLVLLSLADVKHSCGKASGFVILCSLSRSYRKMRMAEA